MDGIKDHPTQNTLNLALHLSFEGIALDARVSGGWARLGDVSLTASDLPAELANLRAAAIERGYEMATKLVLPPDQVRWITLAGSDHTYDSALRAFEGTTPYDVADLAIDWREIDGVTHAAAVAHETLGEAKAFATEHGFGPMAFVALPPDWDGAEVFFGAATQAPAARDTAPYISAPLPPIAPKPAPPLPDTPPAAPLPDTPPAAPLPDAQPAAKQPKPAAPEQAPSQAPAPAAPQPDLSARQTPARITAPDAAPARPDRTPLSVPQGAPEPAVSLGAAQPAPLVSAAAAPSVSAPTPYPQAPSIQAPSIQATASNQPQPNAPLSARITSPDLVAEPAAPVAPAVRTVPPQPNTTRPPFGQATKRAALAPDLPTARLSAATLAVTDTQPQASEPVEAAETSEAVDAEPDAGFFRSRRRGKAPIPAPKAKASVSPFAAPPQASRQIGGKPRFLLLILIAVLLVFMLAMAAIAAVKSPERVVGIFKSPATSFEAPLSDGDVVLAGLESPESAARFDDPEIARSLEGIPPSGGLIAPAAPAPLPSPEDIAAKYQESGIWTGLPTVRQPAAVQDLNDLYVASIDSDPRLGDAIALPAINTALDVRLATPVAPPKSGRAFSYDTDGLILATAQGNPSPKGFTVFAGKPPVVPPLRPDTLGPRTEHIAALGLVRPELRPNTLAETNERASYGGLSRPELAALRAILRPAAPKVAQEADEAPATKFAVATSARPGPRPKGFSTKVAAARAAAQQPDSTSNAAEVTTAAATIAPRVVKPSGRTATTVARAATLNNAINLRKVNLIGVFGKPSSRQALIRMPNGRLLKVRKGDELDGGRVAAIGTASLKYTKRGRNLVLEMPTG